MSLRTSPRVLLVLLGNALVLPALAQDAAPPPPPPPPQGYSAGVAPAPRPPRFELSASAGWTTSSDVNGTSLKIGDAASWGAMVGGRVGPGVVTGLRWVYLDPKAHASSSGGASFQVPTHYFLVQGEKGIRRGRAEPFVTGALGAVMFMPESFTLGGTRYNPETTWRMAFGLGAGVKLWLNEKIALKLGAEMLAPIFFEGGSVYVGTGGAGLGVSGAIPTITGNFTAGLTFAL